MLEQGFGGGSGVELAQDFWPYGQLSPASEMWNPRDLLLSGLSISTEPWFLEDFVSFYFHGHSAVVCRYSYT